MKKFLLLSISAVLFYLASYPQSVSINNDGLAPHSSAMLDVRNPNKGLLVPRVALTGTTDIATIPTPATSLLIYNTATTGTGSPAVTPGYYYWDGAAWLRLNTGSGTGGSWLLTGNTGTDTSVNFLGTTDNRPLRVKINNIRSGYIGMAVNDGNVFWGYQSGLNNKGHSNVGLGTKALLSGTIANNLVAIGDSALLNNTTGLQNTAVGSKTLYSNTTGALNTAIGYNSLRSNTTGGWNTANGNESLRENISGTFNTACGNGALVLNRTGDENTAAGHLALLFNTAGSHNTANGSNALGSNMTGTYNTAVGNFTLISNTTGNFNTAIGNEANVSSGDLTNATALGNGAIVNASDKVRIGNAAVTIIEGQVAYSFPSDARFKYNIQTNVPGLDFIKKLTPVTYYFDEEKLAEYTKTGIINTGIIKSASYKEKQLHTGFLAQDVEKTARQLGYYFDGIHVPANDKDHYSLAYSQFIMPLVKSVQEQQQIIEDQNKKISCQAEQITKMNGKIEALSKTVSLLTQQ